MRYLFDCAKSYISQSQALGSLLWDSVQSEITFVFCHPNGWEGVQQTVMRRAAVRAGLVADTARGRSQVTFVTEGEASFNFCMNNGISADSIQVRFLISTLYHRAGARHRMVKTF